MVTKRIKKKRLTKDPKLKNHSYGLSRIKTIVKMSIDGNIKFRTLERMLKLNAETNELSVPSPTHVTIRNWTLKIGYDELIRKREKANDWIILLDHSIQFGKEKIFVVLGIREKDFLKLKSPLNYTDLTTLSISSKDNWNGDLVSEEIEKIERQVGKIKYAVGDYGSDLRKGLRLPSIVHIHDLSHLIALITKDFYENDERFRSLKSKMSYMRSRFVQTDIAAVVPPKGRSKSEYQSFSKIVKWANAAQHLVENKLNSQKELKILGDSFDVKTLKRIKQELLWILDYKDFIDELNQISQATSEIEKELKYNGLSSSSLEKSRAILDKLEGDKPKAFQKTLISKIEDQNNLLPDTAKILFSSDILESIFGRYKNRVSDNPMASISNIMLIIAAFTVNLTEERIKESIEKVKMEDIKEWTKQNIGTSLFQQRKSLFAA